MSCRNRSAICLCVQQYVVVDSSEDQVVLCVFHNDSTANLYTSSYKGLRYSLSLQSVAFYDVAQFLKTWETL